MVTLTGLWVSTCRYGKNWILPHIKGLNHPLESRYTSRRMQTAVLPWNLHLLRSGYFPSRIENETRTHNSGTAVCGTLAYCRTLAQRRYNIYIRLPDFFGAALGSLDSGAVNYNDLFTPLLYCSLDIACGAGY